MFEIKKEIPNAYSVSLGVGILPKCAVDPVARRLVCSKYNWCSTSLFKLNSSSGGIRFSILGTIIGFKTSAGKESKKPTSIPSAERARSWAKASAEVRGAASVVRSPNRGKSFPLRTLSCAATGTAIFFFSSSTRAIIRSLRSITISLCSPPDASFSSFSMLFLTVGCVTCCAQRKRLQKNTPKWKANPKQSTQKSAISSPKNKSNVNKHSDSNTKKNSRQIPIRKKTISSKNAENSNKPKIPDKTGFSNKKIFENKTQPSVKKSIILYNFNVFKNIPLKNLPFNEAILWKPM